MTEPEIITQEELELATSESIMDREYIPPSTPEELEERHVAIDDLEVMMMEGCEVVELPLKHTFTNDMYIREISAQPDVLATTAIHVTEHPFVVLEGLADVYLPEKGFTTVGSGFSGVTQPGYRRVVYVREFCRWVTYHTLTEEERQMVADGVDEETLVDTLEERIFDHRELEFYGGKRSIDVYKEKLQLKLEQEQQELIADGGELCQVQ